MQVTEEHHQELILPEPELSNDGVSFAVTVEQKMHPCLVTSEALQRLSREHGFSMDAMNTYYAFEAKINSVARSRLLRGNCQAPLILDVSCFH